MAIWASASSVQTDVKKPPKHVQSAERKSLKFIVSINRKDKILFKEHVVSVMVNSPNGAQHQVGSNQCTNRILINIIVLFNVIKF